MPIPHVIEQETRTLEVERDALQEGPTDTQVANQGTVVNETVTLTELQNFDFEETFPQNNVQRQHEEHN